MATEQAFPGQAIAIGGGSVITSPFQFVADADTFLRVVSVCSVTGVVLAVQGRRIDESGQLQPLQETHVPLATRTRKTQDYGLGVGEILNITVFASQGAPLIGQCYVMIQLLRNFGGTAVVLGTLLGGYVTSTQALGFPGSPIQSSTDGEPAVRNITGTQPLVGHEVGESCPTGARWELVTFLARFTTSGVPNTRQPALQVVYGVVSGALLVPTTGVPASNRWFFTWGQNLPTQASFQISFAQQSMPQRQFLRAGDSVQSSTILMDAGDQWDQVQYQVREWLEVA